MLANLEESLQDSRSGKVIPYQETIKAWMVTVSESRRTSSIILNYLKPYSIHSWEASGGGFMHGLSVQLVTSLTSTPMKPDELETASQLSELLLSGPWVPRTRMKQVHSYKMLQSLQVSAFKRAGKATV